jgi:hypothetical protein
VIEELLRPHGLVILGLLPDAVLVGNAGSSCWRHFELSAEFMDGQPHPMDRWSRRIGLAENSSCRQRGCGARRACPAGVEFHYRASHARFHMEAFLVSQKTSKK